MSFFNIAVFILKSFYAIIISRMNFFVRAQIKLLVLNLTSTQNVKARCGRL